MVIQKAISTTNRKKARTGQIYFANGKLAYFAAYGDCEYCGKNGRLLLSPAEARDFSKMFNNSKIPIGARITKRMVKHYSL